MSPTCNCDKIQMLIETWFLFSQIFFDVSMYYRMNTVYVVCVYVCRSASNTNQGALLELERKRNARSPMISFLDVRGPLLSLGAFQME